jgi:hypothetical protein
MSTTHTIAPATGGFLAELRAHLAGFRAALRARRAYPDVLQVEVGEDIVADAERQQSHAARLAYTAQQADIEAGRLLRAAQAPESDGGRAITPREAEPIFRNLTRSAAADQHITEVLA